MTIKTNIIDKTMTIDVDGKFDYSCQKEFRSCYEPTNDAVANYVINLSKASYMDSAAIGMLLVMHDKISSNASIKIASPSSEVRELLDIANIGKVIDVD